MIRNATQEGATAPDTIPAPVAGALPELTLEDVARARGASAAAMVEVAGVEAAPALRRRLLECGFTAGSPVRFVMATPFGDPLVFSLRGASIALRKAEA